MSSEVTKLRLSNFDGKAPSARLEDLANLCQQMQILAKRFSGSLGFRQIEFEMRLSSSPRSGSIVVDFHVIYTGIDAFGDAASKFLANPSNVAAMGGIGTLGSFIWISCFGARGLVDFWTRDVLEEPELNSETSSFFDKYFSSNNASLTLERLVEAARRVGVDRVEVGVNGGEYIAIYTSSINSVPMISNTWRSALRIPSIDHPSVLNFRRIDNNSVMSHAIGFRESISVPIFQATVRRHNALVMWFLDEDPPSAKKKTSVIGGEISISRIRTLGPWPKPYLKARFVFGALAWP